MIEDEAILATKKVYQTLLKLERVSKRTKIITKNKAFLPKEWTVLATKVQTVSGIVQTKMSLIRRLAV
jgi:hypothetical protein